MNAYGGGWGPSHSGRSYVGAVTPSEVQWPIAGPGGSGVAPYEPPSETNWTLIAGAGIALVLGIVLFRGVVK